MIVKYYIYFVSYVFQTLGTKSLGFGSREIALDHKITSIKDLESIAYDEINQIDNDDGYGRYHEVTVLHYSLLRVESRGR